MPRSRSAPPAEAARTRLLQRPITRLALVTKRRGWAGRIEGDDASILIPMPLRFSIAGQVTGEVSMTIVKIVAGVFVTLTFAGAALAQDVGTKSINTGGEKGAYRTLFCPPLPVALSNAYFQGYKCSVSRGTLENIDRVLRNPTNIGFVQLDMYANEAIKRVDDFRKLAVIRSDIACEGLWMVTKNHDLNNYGHVLAVSRG